MLVCGNWWLHFLGFCNAIYPLLVDNGPDGQSTWPAVRGVWGSLRWTRVPSPSLLRASPLAAVHGGPEARDSGPEY